MSEAGFWDVVGRQRAHRRFAEDPVEDDVVSRVLWAATMAPSAENRQPWQFVVVREPAARARIGTLTARAWEGGARQFEEGRLPESLLADVDAGARGGVAGAPVLVVVCGDAERALEATLASSVFPAVQNLLLAATAAGLGSALTTLTTAFARELASLLELPDHARPMAVVPLGYPGRALGPPRREPVEDHTHRERWGRPW